MDTFTLALESTEEIRDYNVETEKFENMADEARLISAGKLIGFTCTSPSLTYAKLQDYLQFFDNQNGPLTIFLFTSRMDGVAYPVRFAPGTFKPKNVSGYFQVTFELMRAF